MKQIRPEHDRLRLAAAAEMLRSAYDRRANDHALGRYEFALPDLGEPLREVARFDRLLRRARALGWHASAQRLRAHYDRAARGLAEALMRPRAMTPDCSPPRLTSRRLLGELAQAEEEFCGLGFNNREAEVSVRTRPIALEGIDLGRFRIAIDIDAMDREDPADWYRVSPLDPNPSGVSDTVTHPHVDSDHLCAGEAMLPIRHALLHGRIADFFLMVRGVLEHYNPHSAYVRLDEWDGVRCYECDSSMSRDCSSFCDCCERDFCSDCVSSCEVCCESTCHGCLEQSQVSDAVMCSGCLARCEDCDRVGTRDEIDSGVCSACAELQSADPTSDHEEVSHGSIQSSP